MFSIAYVILPFTAIAPAGAIRASLAPFQRGGPGDVPDNWLAFEDETYGLRCAHEARFTFTEPGKAGVQVEADNDAYWYLDAPKVRDEMRRRGLERWCVRFADEMDLDTFSAAFGKRLGTPSRDGRLRTLAEPTRTLGLVGPGRTLRRAYHWRSEPGHGARCRGAIVRRKPGTLDPRQRPGPARGGPGPSARARGRCAEQPQHRTRHDPAGGRTRRPPECASRDARVAADAVEDSSRWLGTWPKPGPAQAFAWLGLSSDASWEDVVQKAYARFEDHWAAGIAYHF